MSIVAITGDHPRHRYLVGQLAQAGLLSGWVVEARKAFVPTAPAGLSDHLAKLFDLHFARREDAEARFFGTPPDPGAPVHHVTPETLNDAGTRDFLTARAPRLVLSYGCHKLGDDLMAAVPGARFWNTHGGFSPQYRGVTTHYWPSYLLEPQMTGVTLHETTGHIDGGAVLHQTAALEMHRGDGLHDLAARTVRAYADELPGLLATTLAGELPQGAAQKTSGKIWVGADWRPEHLPLIYDVWEDRICDAVLSGEIAGRVPVCTSVLGGGGASG